MLTPTPINYKEHLLKRIGFVLSKEKLLCLEKPGRYVGGEVNVVQKDISPKMTRFAFCFPDVYEIGMSHLGLQILYFFLNRREDVFCERAFMPWMDCVELLRTENEPLFALESGDGLAAFDFMGFTLQYEMSYTNVLAMLDLAGIPLKSEERHAAGQNFPIVCAGGPCATNPEPLADYVDFFYIGDGEVSLDAIMDAYAACKAAAKPLFIEGAHSKPQEHLEAGHRLRSMSGTSDFKRDFLRKIASIPGVYVPMFYDGGVVQRAFSQRLEFFPDRLIVPLVEATHARAVLEIARGCKRGCRFCQAGFIYRPMRERDTEQLLAQAEQILDATGYDELSLLSLSACDFTNFDGLVDGLLEICEKRRVNISLPSTRLDALDALAKVKTLRKSSLTVAPEAGSQRLRDVIFKNLTEEEILQGCYRAFLAGFDKLKLYFMSGLPTETDEDTYAIVNLCEKIVEKYYELPYEKNAQSPLPPSAENADNAKQAKVTRKRPVSVGVSVACFVPKPFTPFQWAAQAAPQDFAETQRDVKATIRKKQISYRYHDAKTAYIEGVLARGDRRLGAVIEAAYRAGAIFDGWTEFFKYDIWLAAFAETGIQPEDYSHERDVNEALPWDFIDMGVTKEFLQREWERARA